MSLIKQQIKIAIDLMGSDIPPEDLFYACLNLEKNINPNISFLFIGDEKLSNKIKNEKANLIIAKNIILMDENPVSALRKKKDSSVEIGVNLLKKNKADALISAGNTGAIMTQAKLSLTMLPFISRPSLLALIPTEKKIISAIDVGANISSKSKYLIENALLAIAFQKSLGNKTPIVGLLNIGAEAQKGTSELKKTFNHLKKLANQNTDFIFLGNIEAKEVFQSDLDVLVTDGFTGNIFLKTAEGMVDFILNQLNNYKKRHKETEVFLSDFENFFSSKQTLGALLCGIDKIIIKCHSYSSISGFINAINGGISFVEKNIIKSIKENLNISIKSSQT